MDRAAARAGARGSADNGGSAPTDSRMDGFDHRLRRMVMLFYVLGSLSHLLVAHVPRWHAHVRPAVANGLVALGLVSALVIGRLPWRRYGRDLFLGITLYSALLVAGLIYATGGAVSPFEVCFFLVVLFAGLYHPARFALLVAGACAALGFLPLLYASPAEGFVLRQMFLGGGYVTTVWVQRLIMAELVRRARAEQDLRDDLRETRLLRDELARANATLARQATTDALTGLCNHRAIVARADQELARARRQGAPLAILFFDLDGFKGINDTHGHQAGDLVLAGLGGLAGTALREGDTIGRYGGEEFLVLLPGAGREEAARIAARLHTVVRAHPFTTPDGGTITVTISVGVATCRAGDCDRQALLHAADTALYEAKHAGRDRVRVAPLPAGLAVGRR